MVATCKYSSRCSNRCNSGNSSNNNSLIRISSSRKLCHLVFSSLNKEFNRCRECHRDSFRLRQISCLVHQTLLEWANPSHSLSLRFSSPNNHNSFHNCRRLLQAMCLLPHLKPRRIIKPQKIAHKISKPQRLQIRHRQPNNPIRPLQTKLTSSWSNPPHFRQSWGGRDDRSGVSSTMRILSCPS